MSCWKVATKEKIWHDIEKQRCLICGEEGVLRNNGEAWEKFIEVYSPLMWDKVNRFTPESNREDVIQNIYVKLLSYGIPSWCKDPKENFSSYLNRVIINGIWDDLREKLPLPPPPPEDKISTEKLIGVALSLLHLSEEERAVVWLRWIEGYTRKETAKILGKSEDEIEAIEKRVLRKLRKEWVRD